MKLCIRHSVLAALGAALTLILRTESTASARIAGNLDAGLGGSRVQPFIVGRAVCGTVGLGVSTGLRGPARACIELRGTAGREFPSGTLEDANAGHQTIVTILGGLELVNRSSLRGPFFTAGLGVGHSTISGARGPTNSSNSGLVPPRDRTGASYGFGLGYRFSAGPGTGLGQIALRIHGLLSENVSASACATAITVGVAY